MLNAGERRRVVLMEALSQGLSATVALTALIVLAGWALRVPFLTRLVPDRIATNPTAAVALLACVGALEAWRARQDSGRPALRRLQAALSVPVLALGAAETVEHYGGPDLNLDDWLFADRLGSSHVDINTAFALLVAGAGLLALASRRPRAWKAAEWPLLLAGSTGFSAVVGYLYGTVDILPQFGLESMALPMAYGSVALCLAVLFAQPERGLMRVALPDDGGGRLARWLLPLVLVLPPAIGYLYLQGELSGYFDERFALRSIAMTVLTACLVLGWRIAHATSRAAQVLQREQRQFRSLLDTANEAILTLDGEGRIQMANRAAEILFERNEGDLVGQPLAILVPEREQAACSQGLRRFVETGQSPMVGKIGEWHGLRRAGDEFPIELSVGAWTGREGTSFTVIVRDVTRRQMVEGALREARALAESAARAKADFLANMSHEIRTPMNAVIGMTQLLMDTPLDAEQVDYARTIHASGEHLMTVINDILDFSKIESGKVELESIPVELRRFVEETLSLVAPRAAEKKLEISMLVADAVPPAVVGDPSRLRQILLNLLSNAVKFTPRGEVVVHVDATPRGQGVEVHVAVQDTGIGIPKDRFDRLFQTFSQVDASTTRAFGGTGLGLAISKRLVDLMGGRMWVDSEEGKGSTFHFTLPTEATELPAHRARARGQTLQGRRVLVVDDNATNRKVFRIQCERWGMEVMEADGGPQALDHLASADFDVAIIDHQMPGMDGVELCQRIRERWPDKRLPIIVASSLGTKPAGYRDPRFGISSFLTKPIKQSQMLDALMDILVPSDEEKAPEKEARPAAPRLALSVLLAEDNIVNQKVALKMLDKLGAHADIAGNGEEAVAALRSKPYDVVFMDIQMPKMDGLEATRQIRKLQDLARRPTIVAMTADAMPGDRERCIEAGMDDYIAKPVRLESLRAVLEKAKGGA